ncbi:MAG TPA: zinc ribbon domain-containing protein [Candidatus Binatia bacterium]|jgi:putative FmdB family regulatory protein
MPIFEYSCRKCNHRFETIVLAKQEKITCPKCASSSLEKQLSVFSSPASGQDASPSAGACVCTPQTCGCH